MNNEKIVSLRAIVEDEKIAAEKREEAARVLMELEQKPENRIAQVFAKIEADHAKYVADQNGYFKVCGSCYRKQDKDRDVCELCGHGGNWERVIVEGPDNSRRTCMIAAATTYTDEKLNWYIHNSSIDIAFVLHCARILQLRGVPRVRSFWERAGFSITGQPLQSITN